MELIPDSLQGLLCKRKINERISQQRNLCHGKVAGRQLAVGRVFEERFRQGRGLNRLALEW
jgi:hypothetical protein